MQHPYRMGGHQRDGEKRRGAPQVYSLGALGDGEEGAEVRTVFASVSGEKREKGWQARAGWTEGRGGGENFFWCAFLLSFPCAGGVRVPLRPVRPDQGQDYGIC